MEKTVCTQDQHATMLDLTIFPLTNFRAEILSEAYLPIRMFTAYRAGFPLWSKYTVNKIYVKHKPTSGEKYIKHMVYYSVTVQRILNIL